MTFPSAPSVFRSIGLLTVLFATAVHSSTEFGDDPLQPVTSDETVSAGGTVTLTCRVAENDNSSLQWSNTAQQTLYFGEKRALRDNRIQLHRSTPTELSITISEVQLSDEGEYTCSLFTMPVRTARATVTVLGVPSKPHLSGFENPVMEGGSVTLFCSSTGSKPPAQLRWYREDQELPGGQEKVESDPDNPTYKVSSELTLEVSRSDNKAFITCAVDHATLTSGNKKSVQALRVEYSPNVQILPSSDLPREGERFNLQCLGNSNPEPNSYIWQKKDGALPPLAKSDGAFLHFEMLNKSDNGVYLCLADNGIGRSQGAYILLVQVDSSSPSLDSSIYPTHFLSSSSPSVSPGSNPSSISSTGSDSMSSSSYSPGSDPTPISSSGSDTMSSSYSPGSDPTPISSSGSDTMSSSSSPSSDPTSVSSSGSDTMSSSSSPGSDPTSVSSSGSDTMSSSSSPSSDPTSVSSSGSDTMSSSSLTEPASTITSSRGSSYSLTSTGTILYTQSFKFSPTTLSNVLFPDLPLPHDFTPTPSNPPASSATPSSSPAFITVTPSVSIRLNGVYTFTGKTT
uniref:Cell adhesion molecule 3 n=1 Tax=Takifugu rubripes TaxID=31033 RepID=A0A674PBP5_TAKRU